MLQCIRKGPLMQLQVPFLCIKGKVFCIEGKVFCIEGKVFCIEGLLYQRSSMHMKPSMHMLHIGLIQANSIALKKFYKGSGIF